ncbi:methionyl-tRNA formyltransferase [Lachnoanaerobaculum saburreum F0468]|jgi:methionyl-tRNA formyltransferase|uniref:Methionyl-tRNA formyltransferase n=1 Tax=Lachnoanaerobaculum saburreum F0468 TaxID=1095750 RepID=I0R5I5_9FIRM|nr:methionyl-tRNA formyltransferase [Lachnoanaerobaculum saburreum]EIC94943.1 methionyl-tRNA formyltransferase [Lachnoanaerobaculum saburreum F0468]
MKIVFMGTPDFSLQPLKKLIEAGHYVSLVLTREDKKRNRGELSPTPVKELAQELNIPVLTPSRMKDEALLERLNSEKADFFVVVAYGKILPKEILDMPKFGCINIHASLLPEYRGAAPIQWSIIDGKKKTGITTMLMDEGLDTGDILKQYELPIANNETGGSLFEKLALLGGEAIVDTIDNFNNITPKKQGESTTGYAKMISKSMGDIDFNKSAIEIERLIRGMNPWPSAYTKYMGKVLKIWEAKVAENISELPNIKLNENYGKIYSFNNRIFIICNSSVLEVMSLQLEGKKKMSAKDFLLGREIEQGYVLGSKV